VYACVDAADVVIPSQRPASGRFAEAGRAELGGIAVPNAKTTKMDKRARRGRDPAQPTRRAFERAFEENLDRRYDGFRKPERGELRELFVRAARKY
jgi:hypothetical protein